MRKVGMFRKVGMILLLYIITISLVNAETDVFLTSVITSNGTIWRDQSFVYYLSDFYNFVKPPMNFYIKYWCDDSVADWNIKYPNHQIANITLRKVYQERKVGADGSFGTYTSYNDTIIISNLTAPFHDFFEFYSLNQKESQTITLDTAFVNSSMLVRDSPCAFDTFVATKGCNRCMEYDFIQFQQDKTQANTIQSYMDGIKSKIEQFFGWQWEFALIIYWIAIISILLFTISIVLWIVFWFVHFLRHFFK